MNRKLSLAALALALSACATVPEAYDKVRVIGKFSPAPTGCQDLGPVALTGASMLTYSPVSSPQDEQLRLLTMSKGGDTLHYTNVFPLKGEAYRCGGEGTPHS